MIIQEFVHDSGYVFNDPEDGELVIHAENVVKILKEYGRLLCNKQKQICAENGTASIINWDEPIINKSSILNAPYPQELL